MAREIQRIIGESSTLLEALDHVSAIASLNRSVLIIGERGSGKELVAERLHYLSPRWEKEFHKVNCGAISEQLLDSDLFGHDPGAFTGAEKVHYGRFERADGSTLFLDELATMPMRIQEKLLRLIEYGEFERLGGQKTITVDVRIVAATNANLPNMAKNHLFREDLLDRLAFDVINVPPLRKRIDDIPELVEHFAVRMIHELGWDYYSGFTKNALSKLLHYSWPGNIRELKNVVERSICRWGRFDEPIDEVVINPFEDSGLDDHQESSHNVKVEPRAQIEEHNEEAKNFRDAVKRFELSLLKKALVACHYHQRDTAEYLGLTYHQCRALLKKYKNELGEH